MHSESLERQLKRHEGLVLHAYQDHLGFWTIGYGRLIDERRGGGISEDEALILLRNDINKVERELRSRVTYWHDLPPVKRQALLNMAFQLGVGGLMQFRRMWAAIARRDWDTAAREALDSRWAQQTPRRANEIAGMLRDG